MLITIHKDIFCNVCNKDFEIYNDFIHSIITEYTEVISELRKVTTCTQTRFLIHKLVSVISIIVRDSSEIYSLCNLILNIEKSSDQFELYSCYVKQVIDYDLKKILVI
jgi:hypothetical protein